MYPLKDCAVLVSNKLLSLEKRLDGVRIEEFSSETPKEVIWLISQIISILQKRLKRYIDQIKETTGQRDEWKLYKMITGIGASAAALAQSIRYIEGARVENNPWGMVEVVEAFCKSICSNLRILIRPRWRYGYEYVDLLQQIKDVFYLPEFKLTEEYQELESIFSKAPEIFVLSFPSMEIGNILQNAAWAHEIGHILDSVLFKTSQPTITDPKITSLSSNFARNYQFEAKKKEKLLNLTLTSQGIKLGELTDYERRMRRNDLTAKLLETFEKWLSEVTADLFSIYLLGLAPLFALFHVVLSTQNPVHYDDNHPRPSIRLSMMMKYITKLGYINALQSIVVNQKGPQIREKVIGELDKIRTLFNTPVKFTTKVDSLRVKILEDALEKSFSGIKGMVERNLKGGCVCAPNTLINKVGSRIKSLQDNVPPNEMRQEEEERLDGNGNKDSVSQLALILNAGWFYWIAFKPVMDTDEESNKKFFNEYKRFNRLILKALQSFYMQNEFIKKREKYRLRQPEGTKQVAIPEEERPIDTSEETLIRDGALAKEEIINRLEDDSSDRKLIVNPILDREGQIGACSIDIRLGNEFIVTRRTKVPSIDAASPDIESNIEQYQSKIYVPLGKALTLHPHQFVLGSTFEYLGMPSNLCSIVVGKSSWGRLGLVIATATKIDPNFRGCITLELVNVGDVPIELYPGAKIGQLIVFTTSSPTREAYEGKYKDTPIGPGFSKVYDDKEWKFLFKPQMRKPTEAEIEKIVSLLREGKSLPEDYKSLLFDTRKDCK